MFALCLFITSRFLLIRNIYCFVHNNDTPHDVAMVTSDTDGLTFDIDKRNSCNNDDLINITM
jgi:hypothetical protein